MNSQNNTRVPSEVASVHTECAGAMPLRFFRFYILLFFAAWSLRALVLIRIDESIQSDLWKNVFSNAIKFLIWVVPVFIALMVGRIDLFRFLKLNTRLNGRGLLIIVIVVVIWLSLVAVGESVLSGRSLTALLSQRSSQWLSILVSIFISPIWEEILFRGFFLNWLAESFTFWKSNLISAVLFMGAHLPYWMSRNGLSTAVIKDSLNVFLLGCLFGWVMKKTNSLWPSIGAHIANNFLSGLIHG